MNYYAECQRMILALGYAITPKPMREQDTHTMEQHLSDRLRDYEKANRELRAENLRLKNWIKEEGIRTDACTFHVLGRQICENCQCSRKSITP